MNRAILLALLFAASPATGAERVVWRIGKPDHSYAEFAIAGNYPAYAAGSVGNRSCLKSAAAIPRAIGRSSTPAPTTPGRAGGSTRERSASRLPIRRAGLFTLRIELVDVNSLTPPRYAVSVGRQTGSFSLAPGAGDSSLTDPRAGRPQWLELVMPAGFFKTGANEIRLAPIEGSWALYDAITLLNDPDREMPAAEIQCVTASPTPFFVRRDGQVRRAVNVLVSLTAPAAELSLRVEAGGRAFDVPVKRQSPCFSAVSEEIGVPDSHAADRREDHRRAGQFHQDDDGPRHARAQVAGVRLPRLSLRSRLAGPAAEDHGEARAVPGPAHRVLR